jgi:glycosyltransferase involved in cell wall biosynthesis
MLYLPGQVIGMEGHLVSGFDTPDDPLSLEGQTGAAIWQFLGDDSRSRIALQLRRQGVRTIMELDDNYLRYSPPLYGKAGAWQKTHVEALQNGTGYSIEMHRKVVDQMDALIVSTEALADDYDRFLAKRGADVPIYVCPNSVDPTDWDIERTESDTLRIGYYGSPSHMKDWPLAKKAMKWAAKQPDVEVVMIGFTPPGWSGKLLPWADNIYDARKNLGQIDVGIAPLKVNPWSEGKSDVKGLEYAMAGVMPIMQDAPPYRPWKDEWSWEWMARTEDDWMELIQDIVKNRDLVPGLAASAKGYVTRLRTIQGNIHHWRAAVDGT